MFAYLDCSSGISGDMFLAALLDAGAPIKDVEKALSALKLRGVKLIVRKEKRGAIQGCRVIVNVPQKSKERDWKTIKGMLNDTPLLPGVRQRALRVFEALAKAEARIHGEAHDHVHFHEVGALDSIVDIVCGCAALESLGITELATSPVPLGSGSTDSRHGKLPLPAPATLELLAGAQTCHGVTPQQGIMVYGAGIEGELTTPTGAAILRAFASGCGPMPLMRIQKIGYGAGSKSFPDRPNVLRIVLGELVDEIAGDRAVVIEANVDDMSPQDFDQLMESLFASGALDVAMIPVHMKKNRPGVMVQALAPEGSAGAVTLAMFRHSSTLGVRTHTVDRRILSRVDHVAKTKYGDIHYKRVGLPGGAVRIVPEYENLKDAAKKARVAIEQVRRLFWSAITE